MELTKEMFDKMPTVKDVKAKQYYLYKTGNQFLEKITLMKSEIEKLTGKERNAKIDEYKQTVKDYVALITPKRVKSTQAYKNFKTSIDKAKKPETVLNGYNKAKDNAEKYNKSILLQAFNKELKKNLALNKLEIFKKIKGYAKMSNEEMLAESEKFANPESENYNPVQAELFSLFANIKDASAMKILVALANLSYLKKTSKTFIAVITKGSFHSIFNKLVPLFYAFRFFLCQSI